MTVSHLCTDRDPVFVRMDIVDFFSHTAVDRHRHHRRSGHVFTAENLSIADYNPCRSRFTLYQK
jgi:hypothetical protein